MYKCEICSKEFKSKRSLSCHKNHHNPDYKEKALKGSKALQSEKANISRKEVNEKRKLETWSKKTIGNCIICEKILEYPNYSKTCSDKCQNSYRAIANSRKMSEETRLKISDKLKRKIIKERNCKICGNIHYNPKRVTCSRECFGITRRKLKLDIYEKYKEQSAFRFNLKDFPEEFNFKLIEEFGWYRPSNALGGHNPSGISRDHKISVKFGFKNSINPKLLAHPANCKLMKHTENTSKGMKCDITVDELILLIEEWDIKYGHLITQVV